MVLDLEFRMFLWDTQSREFHSKSSVRPYSALGLILPPTNPNLSTRLATYRESTMAMNLDSFGKKV